MLKIDLMVRYVPNVDRASVKQNDEPLMLREVEVHYVMHVRMVAPTETLKVFEGTQNEENY